MIKFELMRIIDKNRKEFTARYLADISKAIFAVALASKLFVELAVWIRITLPILGFLIFAIAFFIQPKGEEK